MAMLHRDLSYYSYVSLLFVKCPKIVLTFSLVESSQRFVNVENLFFYSSKREITNFLSRALLINYNNAQIASLYAFRVKEFYRKIHFLTREFSVKLHAKTDIARIAKR